MILYYRIDYLTNLFLFPYIFHELNRLKIESWSGIQPLKLDQWRMQSIVQEVET